MLKKLLAMLLTLTLVLSLTACGGDSGEGSSGDTGDDSMSSSEATGGGEDILIGAIYPLSGSVAAIGQNIQKGVDFAVEMINEAGGINGSMVKIVYGDSQGAPKVGLSEAERLITQENVVAMIGCYQSGVTEVVAPIAEQYGVPLLTAISTADVLTTHGYEYFFRLAPSNMMFLRDMIQYLADVSEEYPDLANVETIAICADNSLLGQETAYWATYWAEQNGIEVVAEVLYTQGAADLTSEVLTLKESGADALVVDNYISDGILLTKTMNEQGYKPDIMIGKATAYIDPSFIPTVGDIANGITTAAEFNPGTKAVDVSDAFEAEYGVPMNGHSAEAFTAVWIMKTAIEQATAVESAAIKEALSAIKIEDSFPGGPEIPLPYSVIEFGEAEFDGTTHTNTNTGAVLTILQIQDGAYETVWPFDIASAEPIIPAPLN